MQCHSADHLCVSRSGDKVTVKAHGGMIDIQGIIVAKVNDKLEIESIEVWFDPMEMFRQIAKNDDAVITPFTGGGDEAPGCPVAH